MIIKTITNGTRINLAIILSTFVTCQIRRADPENENGADTMTLSDASLLMYLFYLIKIVWL